MPVDELQTLFRVGKLIAPPPTDATNAVTDRQLRKVNKASPVRKYPMYLHPIAQFPLHPVLKPKHIPLKHPLSIPSNNQSFPPSTSAHQKSSAAQ
jgi:hypothetical protein